MATLPSHSHACGVENLAEHPSSETHPETHQQLSGRLQAAWATNRLLGLLTGMAAIFTAAAAIFSGIAAYKANEISERHYENMVQHVRYHYEISDIGSWNVKLYQISGSPYPLNVVTFKPFFNDGTIGKPLAKSKLKHDKQQSYPQYIFANIEDEICREQKDGCAHRSIVTLTVEYMVYDERRSLRLP